MSTTAPPPGKKLNRLGLDAQTYRGSKTTLCAGCGHEVVYELSGGAADANVFNERGLECVNLANGMTDIHTPNEHIAAADLDAMVDVTLALLEGARA